jgi:hypothetical protein
LGLLLTSSTRCVVRYRTTCPHLFTNDTQPQPSHQKHWWRLLTRPPERASQFSRPDLPNLHCNHMQLPHAIARLTGKHELHVCGGRYHHGHRGRNVDHHRSKTVPWPREWRCDDWRGSRRHSAADSSGSCKPGTDQSREAVSAAVCGFHLCSSDCYLRVDGSLTTSSPLIQSTTLKALSQHTDTTPYIHTSHHTRDPNRVHDLQHIRNNHGPPPHPQSHQPNPGRGSDQLRH